MRRVARLYGGLRRSHPFFAGASMQRHRTYARAQLLLTTINTGRCQWRDPFLLRTLRKLSEDR
jgi:hypothetical protein